MTNILNAFGMGQLLGAKDLQGSIYAKCTACMGIYSEFLTWANANEQRIVKSPKAADNIIVLSCQVTDLAILNDLRHLETLIEEFKDYPEKKFFVGGCLAKRFDIKLPRGVQRLNNIDSDNNQIKKFDLVDYAKPFWVKDFSGEDNNELSPGNIFRDMYPLRISVGCKSNCSYCTIKITRGKCKEIPYEKTEFQQNDNILLIADSPTVGQIEKWCERSLLLRKRISIRNIEPKVVVKTANSLFYLAQQGLLGHFHSPIQHTDANALRDMGRNWFDAMFTITVAKTLKLRKVITATNIIIDYKEYKNPIGLDDAFDYISWNPYWDGSWNREKAEQRFEYYLD